MIVGLRGRFSGTYGPRSWADRRTVADAVAHAFADACEASTTRRNHQPSKTTNQVSDEARVRIVYHDGRSRAGRRRRHRYPTSHIRITADYHGEKGVGSDPFLTVILRGGCRRPPTAVTPGADAAGEHTVQTGSALTATAGLGGGRGRAGGGVGRGAGSGGGRAGLGDGWTMREGVVTLTEQRHPIIGRSRGLRVAGRGYGGGGWLDARRSGRGEAWPRSNQRS
jgi:hypothetical protein